MIYPNAISDLQHQLDNAPYTEMTTLAERLIKGAQNYDNYRVQKVVDDPEYVSGVAKDFNNATHFVANHIMGAPYADDLKAPLDAKGEFWNKGRRTTLDGQKYDIDENGLPINPYLETGITGLGVIGRYGPNHAVDVGLLSVQKDDNGQLALHAYGILKGKTPYFCGGFAEYDELNQDGFIIGRDIWIDNQAKEFFEEMVSGSIELLPEFAEQLEDKFQSEIAHRVERRGGIAVPDGEYNLVKKQIETELKMEQVEKYDPEFFKRVRSFFAQGKECYRGPVRSSARNTNTSWMETYLSWAELDEQNWNDIRGDQPVFDYQLSAGDDADGVKAHRIDSDLLDATTGTHSAMFLFMAASYVLDQQEKDYALTSSVMDQLKEVASFLEQIPSTPKIKYDHLKV